jgi:hypothetical protein
MATNAEVLSQAVSLSEDGRAQVTQELLLSLDEPMPEDDHDEAWATEILRRRESLRNGTVTPIDWDEALVLVQDSLKVDGP